MSQPIQNVSAQGQQILVETFKGPLATINYSATDTIRALKEKIMDSEGIPVAQQRLYADYDYTKCWQRQELDDPNALLVQELRNVTRVIVSVNLSGS